jgi:hypothetical protein
MTPAPFSSDRTTQACAGCGHLPLKTIWDAGPVPIANRFYSDAGSEHVSHNFVLALCGRCALLQLVAPAPPELLRRQAGWIQYNEPEAHLDAWVERTVAAFAQECQGTILGLSPVDATTIARFTKKGLRAATLDPARDLGVHDPLAGTETVQAALGPEQAAKIRKEHGAVSIVVARYVLEHAHDLPRFFQFVAGLLNRDGVLQLEVPACEAAIQEGDAAMLWDQHTFYFTRATLARCLAAHGFLTDGAGLGVERIGEVILATARRADATAGLEAAPGEILAARDFPRRAGERAVRVQEFLRSRGEAPLLLGAGHLANAFCAFVCPPEKLAGILDDHPEKVGKYLGNCPTPIQSTSEIETGQSRLLLHSLSDASAARVRQKLGDFFARGGDFYSILAGKGDTIPL